MEDGDMGMDEEDQEMGEDDEQQLQQQMWIKEFNRLFKI